MAFDNQPLDTTASGLLWLVDCESDCHPRHCLVLPKMYYLGANLICSRCNERRNARGDKVLSYSLHFSIFYKTAFEKHIGRLW